MTEYIFEVPDNPEIFVRDKYNVRVEYELKQREEIVRCRDCKYIELQTVSYSVNPLYVCLAEWCEGSEGDNPLVVPFGFCAWGERR